ncbi:MAG: Gfo/Idh/MocA family oxidoreductase [Candidatus Pacebacteria bacterium]|nr:Gfo/Idh/MocA family oxidoreductase [Candidatus Paceibacterota bacterium]
MLTIGIVGGETHIGEVTALKGKALEIAGAAVRSDQVDWARQQFACPVYEDYTEMLAVGNLDCVAVANENDRKAEAVLTALQKGCDVIVDKPMAITLAEQEKIEAFLAAHSERRLLMLLTLRGRPLWAGLRDIVRDGSLGTPAFTHVRMAVRLKRDQRPPWFLDVRRSGGLFLDLLVHGLDQVEWITGRRIVAMTANTGNLGDPADTHLRDHAAVYCELDDGSSAVVEGQRMLPDTKGSDYRVTVAGTKGYADLMMADNRLVVTTPTDTDRTVTECPEPVSVVGDWLAGGELVGQAASLRANHLAIMATQAAAKQQRM